MGSANTSDVCCLNSLLKRKQNLKLCLLQLIVVLSLFLQGVKLGKQQSTIQIFWTTLSGPVENTNVFSSLLLTW